MRLNDLTPALIEKGPVSLEDILRDSVYYPASRTDGRPVALCNTVWRRLGVNSFVYCDFDLSEREFLANTRTMHGYHVIARRHLDPSEYIPAGWTLEMVPSRVEGRRGRYWDTFLGGGGPDHCACWVVFERNADMNPVHGPERLSVLFVCGEGLATFQQLYCSRGIAPKMLCFIQCWGFAGNWTDFSACGAPFHKTLLKYRECTPEWLCFGDCCGIHGAVRLRNLGYARVRCLGYRTREAVERIAGETLAVVEEGPERSVLTYSKGGRTFAALSVSHHMEYAVYDISDSRFGKPETLLDWLILTDPGRRAGHESFLGDWIGVRGLDPEEDGVVPILDEKLDWRDLDRWPSVAKAMALVLSVGRVYGEGGVRCYSTLVRDAMTWARAVLEGTTFLPLADASAGDRRGKALAECREWFDRLPSYRLGVSANIGFGRDGKDCVWEDDLDMGKDGFGEEDLEGLFDDTLPGEGTPLRAVMEENGILTSSQRARYGTYDRENPGCSPENPIAISEEDDYVHLEYEILEYILRPVPHRFVDYRVTEQRLIGWRGKVMDVLTVEVFTHPVPTLADGGLAFPEPEPLGTETYWFDITAGFGAMPDDLFGTEGKEGDPAKGNG